MIQVGELVRNKYGIAKVINIEEQDGMQVVTFDRNIVYMVNVKTGEIKDDNLINKLPVTHNIDFSKIKHSFNIIDLVEVGDYVNGHKIINIDTDPFISGQINLWTNLYEMDTNGDRWRTKYIDKDIKSIVTKEQFENAEYKVEE